MEQHSEPVVVESSEAVAGALDLLDSLVQPFGWAVGGAGGAADEPEDLGSLRGEGVAERADLGDLIGLAAGDRFVQQHRGVGAVEVRPS